MSQHPAQPSASGKVRNPANVGGPGRQPLPGAARQPGHRRRRISSTWRKFAGSTAPLARTRAHAELDLDYTSRRSRVSLIIRDQRQPWLRCSPSHSAQRAHLASRAPLGDGQPPTPKPPARTSSQQFVASAPSAIADADPADTLAWCPPRRRWTLRISPRPCRIVRATRAHPAGGGLHRASPASPDAYGIGLTLGIGLIGHWAG
jgi:hypothetical protein